MQFLLAFFVSIFLFVSLFVTSIGNIVEKKEYRIAKQNLNLTGREIVNYISFDEEQKIVVHEESFLRSIAKSNNVGNILGGIFCYEDVISVIDLKFRDNSKISIPTISMNEENKVNTINNMVNFIISGIENYEINISLNDIEDIMKDEFFNKIEKNTFFIIGEIRDCIYISGFNIETENLESEFRN